MMRVGKRVVVGLILLSWMGCHQDLSSPESANAVSTRHLRYFGFAVVDCGWDDPNDSTVKTNYVDEVSRFTNIGQMCVFSPDESLRSRMARFSQVGMKAILHIESILFEHTKDTSSPSGVRVTLRPDAEALWAHFVKLNRDVLVPDYVVALYIVDEPVWNGVPLADFVHALKIVKASLPVIPTLSIEAYPVVTQIRVPETLDWIGFDRYDTADPAKDRAWLADLETVRAARTRTDQKIVIIASTQWLPYYQTDAGVLPEDMAAVAYSYYHIAVSDPDVIALVGYLWPGGLDDPRQLGARNLPENVQQALREIGRRIINK